MRMRIMSKGTVLIVSGPSGSGKDTILKEVFKALPDIKFSISSITRAMREGEVEGEKYNFISRESFLDIIKNDMLLEYNMYLENYYGTPRKPVDEVLANGGEMIIEVDVNGAKSIREKLPEAVSVFIMPPSFEVLKARLSGRGTESEEIVEKRLKEAMSEISRASEYDYIVVNDDLSDAVDDLVSIIKSERHKTNKNIHLVNEVLLKC
jgi:guanylate kinase